MQILLADGQTRVRYALRVLLEQHGEGIQEAADAQELLVNSAGMQPDLVLLDWALPGMPLEGLIPALRESCPETVIVVLGSRPEAMGAAVAAGADAYVGKTDTPDKVLAAVRAAGKARKAQGDGVRPRNADTDVPFEQAELAEKD